MMFAEWEKVTTTKKHIHSAYIQLSSKVERRKKAMVFFLWVNRALVQRTKQDRILAANSFHTRNVLCVAFSKWISTFNERRILMVPIPPPPPPRSLYYIGKLT